MNIKSLLQKAKNFVFPSKESLILMVDRELRRQGVEEKLIPTSILFALILSDIEDSRFFTVADAKKEFDFICSVLNIPEERKAELMDEALLSITKAGVK